MDTPRNASLGASSGPGACTGGAAACCAGGGVAGFVAVDVGGATLGNGCGVWARSAHAAAMNNIIAIISGWEGFGHARPEGRANWLYEDSGILRTASREYRS